MAKEDTLEAMGRSGAKYQFDVYPWGTAFKSVGAVYKVYRKEQNGVFWPVYIGETGNLQERFDDHHKAMCFITNGRTHIGILPEINQQRRREIEADLIANHKPPCNE